MRTGDRNYGPPVDMWGAGCIMAEMWTRSPIMQVLDIFLLLQPFIHLGNLHIRFGSHTRPLIILTRILIIYHIPLLSAVYFRTLLQVFQHFYMWACQSVSTLPDGMFRRLVIIILITIATFQHVVPYYGGLLIY